jgi:catechol 2,3-dioxygenase-like lactoylglutathione lyase family enzyme
VILAAEPQLFVTDIDRACAWYRDRLGFTVAFVHGEPAFYAQVSRDGAALNLRHIDAPVFASSEEDLLAATLTTDDIDALATEFAASGADLHQPLRTEEWGARTLIARDPDGNLILFAG